MPDSITAVLDTNVIVDALLGRRRSSLGVVRALFAGRFRAVATIDVLTEYQVVLRSRQIRDAAVRADLTRDAILEYAEAVAVSMEVVDAGPAFRCADPDDVKFTAASSGGHAAFLVTSDDDLLSLHEILEARVVTPDDFLEVLR